MSSATLLSYLPNFAAEMFQSKDAKQTQESFGRMASTGKLVSLIVGITSAAFLAFSILGSGLFALIGVLLFSPLTLLAYDSYVACKNALQASKEAKNFTFVQFKSEKVQQEGVLALAKKTTEGTFIWGTILSMIEARAKKQA